MSLGRRDKPARARLVLLRGGLDVTKSAPESGDWSAFCDRIGFMPGGPLLADDFEQRLAESVFRAPPTKGVASPLEPVVRASVGEVARGERLVHAHALRYLSLGAAAAALILIVLATLLSASERPTASETPTRDPDSDAAKSIRVLPETPKPDESDTAEPIDSALPVAVPKPPGSLIAVRPRRAEGPSAEDVPSGEPHPRVELDQGASTVASNARSDAPTRSASATEPSDVLDTASPILPRAELASLPSGWTDVEATPVRHASKTAAWSVSGGDRWYGVALSPTREPTAGVGVMAQLDLGRALDKL